jgi:tetratricopeptide (TPR) repeat protein
LDELKEIIYLYQRLQKYGKAINICNKVLKVEPDNEKVLKQKELLNEILKFTQLDIFAATNLWNDPWFE